MSDTLAVINYIRKLEARIAALERQEGGGGGAGFNDTEGDPANVTSAAADGTSTYAARRDHAHTIAAGTVTAAMMQDGAALAEILDDDGTGSGLDADLLDGQHATAFLEVDGGNYMTGNLGVKRAASSYEAEVEGTLYATTGARVGSGTGGQTQLSGGSIEIGQGRSADGYAYIDMVGDTTYTDYGLRVIRGNTGENSLSEFVHRGTGEFRARAAEAASFGIYTSNTERVRVASDGTVSVRNANGANVHLTATAADKTSEIRFHDNTSTLKGKLLYAGGNTSPNKYFGFVNSGAEDLRFFSDLTQFWSSSAELARLDSSGQWGFGVTSPQGKLHTSDGAGRTLIGSKTAITGTAQTIVPNGTGDVTKLLRYEIICSDGTNHTSAVGALAISGTADVVCGSNTYQLRVNADGSVDIRRTAGSTNGTATYRLLWL